MNKATIISSLEEAATDAYRRGFDEGYDAAQTILKTVADLLKAEAGQDVNFDAIHALDVSKARAFEMLHKTTFMAEPVSVTPVQSERYQ